MRHRSRPIGDTGKLEVHIDNGGPEVGDLDLLDKHAGNVTMSVVLVGGEVAITDWALEPVDNSCEIFSNCGFLTNPGIVRVSV